jgi:DNA-binding NarL/FixJ family response regulator
VAKLRIVLADDHPEVLETVARLLDPVYEVVGTARDGQSLVDAVMKLKPDLLITDISMPILNGIEAAQKLSESGCTAKIVFLTVHSDSDYVRACLATGALGYVIKSRTPSDLLPAIQEALAGRIFVSPSVSSKN